MAERRPRGYRTADDVHRALRMRAAETGESMEDILDRALRKELGLMDASKDYAGLRLYHKFLGGNLFEGWSEEQLAGVDEKASINEYAEALRKRLEAEYPGAEIDVEYEVNASGGMGETYVEDLEDDHMRYYPASPGYELERMAFRILEIAGLLHEDSYWVVMENKA